MYTFRNETETSAFFCESKLPSEESKECRAWPIRSNIPQTIFIINGDPSISLEVGGQAEHFAGGGLSQVREEEQGSGASLNLHLAPDRLT